MSWRTLFRLAAGTIATGAVMLVIGVRSAMAGRRAEDLMFLSPLGSAAFASAARTSTGTGLGVYGGFGIAFLAALVVVFVAVTVVVKLLWPVRPAGEQRGFEVIR